MDNNTVLYKTGIFSITSIAVMGISLVVPIIPDIARHFNVSATDVGWVIMAYTIPGILMSLVCGILADVFGRKAVLIPGVLCFSLGGVLCALSETFTQLLLCRAIQGLGGGITGVMYSTLVADRYQGENLTKMMGQVTAAMSLCTAVFPLIGGILGEIAWHLPFWLTSGGGLVAILFFFVPLKGAAPQFNMAIYLRHTRAAASNPHILVFFLLTMLCYSIFYGPMNTYFPLLAHERFHVTSSRIGLIFMLGSIGSALMAASLGWLSTRFSLRMLMLVAALCYGTSQALILNMPTIWWCMLPLAVCGIAQGLAIPILNRSVASSAEADNRAALLALNGSVFRSSQSCAPLLYGMAWTTWGWTGPYYVGVGVALLIGFIVALFFGRVSSHASTTQSLQGVEHTLPH